MLVGLGGSRSAPHFPGRGQWWRHVVQAKGRLTEPCNLIRCTGVGTAVALRRQQANGRLASLGNPIHGSGLPP
jgi:hypothetical protein